MAVFTNSSTFLQDRANDLYIGKSFVIVPVRNQGVLTAASTLQQWLNLEVKGTTLNMRQAVAPLGGSVVSSKYRTTPVIAVLEAEVNSTIDTILLIKDGSSNQTAATISSVNTGTDVLTLSSAAHLADGDEIVFTNTTPANIPGGLAASTLYTVSDKSGDTIKVKNAAGTSYINLTSTGSGTTYVGVANGTFEGFSTITTITIPAGGSVSYSVYFETGVLA